MPKLESVKSEPTTDDARYMTLAPAKPAKLDLGASGELLDADYYQNKRARPIKHTADREVSIHFLFRMYALDERRKNELVCFAGRQAETNAVLPRVGRLFCFVRARFGRGAGRRVSVFAATDNDQRYL